MKIISFILIIFFLLVGQNIAEPSDTLSPWEAYEKAIKEVDEDKTLTRDVKEKVKAQLSYEYYYQKNQKLETKKWKKEESEIWKLIRKNNYTTALQKTDEAENISAKEKIRLKQTIILWKEINVPIPKDDAIFQKIEEAKHISEENKFILTMWHTLSLLRKTSVPTPKEPKDKVKALELEIKKLELRILFLEGNLDNELELIDSRRERDVSRIEMRLLDLEDLLR